MHRRLVGSVLSILLATPVLAGGGSDARSIESLLRRNPRGLVIVEEMARHGNEEAMMALCQAGITSGGESSKKEPHVLAWCSRAAALGHPKALRELGSRLVASRDRAHIAEGTVAMVLAEVMGDPLASLEVSLLPDFFGVGSLRIREARSEAVQRIEAGRFHIPKRIGLDFALTSEEREVQRRRLRRALQVTATLGDDATALRKKLAARRARAEHGELVSRGARASHRQQLVAKDALQVRLAADLKRASEESSDLSEWEREAKADRLKRVRMGAVLHTERVDASQQAALEIEIEKWLAGINRHRAPDAALGIDDVGLPWRDSAARTATVFPEAPAATDR